MAESKKEAGVEEDKDHRAPDDSGVEKKDGEGAPPAEDKKEDEQKVDWKAAYEAAKADGDEVRDERDNYKEALKKKRQLRNKGNSPRSEDDDDSDLDEDDDLDGEAPVKVKDLERVITRTVLPALNRTATEDKVTRTIEGLVKDPDKRKLVRLNYDTRIRQMGTSDEDIARDVRSAIDLTDAPHIRKVNSEQRRVMDNHPNAPLHGAGNEPEAPSGNHKFSDAQVADLTAKAKNLGVDPKRYIENVWKNSHG